jgi:hypothetical protein
MNSFLQDMRYAMQQLRRDPSFTAVVLLILALGIGANARTFSVAHDALLKPLPWDERNPEKERTNWLAPADDQGSYPSPRSGHWIESQQSPARGIAA